MKKLTTFFSLLALACTVNVANADILTLPDEGMFIDNMGVQVFFEFPPNGTDSIESINSIAIDLTHTWASDVAITLAGPAGANFILALNQGGSSDLDGTYTFVNPLGPDATGTTLGLGGSGAGNNVAGTYDAFSWTDGPLSKQGWVLNFQDVAGGDTGTFSNITIDFNKTAVIPEPASALILLSVAGLAIVRRRR